jgi:hypothetical protein
MNKDIKDKRKSKTMLKIIGDVHGHYDHQLGDFGFDYSCLNDVDGSRHKIVPGNHDNYDQIKYWPDHIFQDDFGLCKLGGSQFAYIRGAYSVDKKYRIAGVSWWENEQMSWGQGKECVRFIKKEKPDIILSHDCPFCIVPMVATNNWKLTSSTTGEILQNVFYEWQPRFWNFGHHHQTKRVELNGTIFQCLDELAHIDIGE